MFICFVQNENTNNTLDVPSVVYNSKALHARMSRIYLTFVPWLVKNKIRED